METFNLVENGNLIYVLLNIFLSVTLCITATWLGILLEAVMKTIKIVVVRIYITESSGLLNKVVKYLKNEIKIRGVTVFRAISGFGETGSHSASLVELSLDLPLIIEFFDSKEKVTAALNYLDPLFKPEHIIFWEANANEH